MKKKKERVYSGLNGFNMDTLREYAKRGVEAEIARLTEVRDRLEHERWTEQGNPNPKAKRTGRPSAARLRQLAALEKARKALAAKRAAAKRARLN